MDQLRHNSVIKLVTDSGEHFYRVILDEPARKKTALVEIVSPSDDDQRTARGGRRRLEHTARRRAKPALPNTTAIIWFHRPELESLASEHLLLPIEFELERPYFVPPQSERGQQEFDRRRQLARLLLDSKYLRESLLIHGTFGPLIKETMALGCSRAQANKILSLLIRFGFHEKSLRDRRFRCGAPGQPRPCDPGGRRKAGRKTNAERLARKVQTEAPPQQPGVSTEWIIKILGADKKNSKLRMKMPERIDRILKHAFVQAYTFVNGVPVAVDLRQGQYPNRRQIIRVLTSTIPKMEELQNKTTAGHFQRNHRSLKEKAWKGIPGPGHTWCIDSTVGDIYLRSILNRTWIVGRPVVYVIVDVWSTAVMGFHVCLQHPSWPTAKIALFNCVAPPELMSALYGFSFSLALNPLPTLPASLWMDNGEYKSQGGRFFGMYVPDESFTPPRRPDWHGMTEVLHRIGKDRIQAIPGAIDARRKELEIRQYRPGLSVMTLPEFVEYLYTVFWRYNLTANRAHRLDATMKACGVVPSPAGLWRFGHDMGIGTQREFTRTTLITDMLPASPAHVTRNGVFKGQLDYGWPPGLEDEWGFLARNRHGWKLPGNYHPASLSKTWILPSSGLIELDLADTAIAPPHTPLFDFVDQMEHHTQSNAKREHETNLIRLQALERETQLIRNAKSRTREADALSKGGRPDITTARQMELESSLPPQDLSDSGRPFNARPPREAMNDAGQDHLAWMAQLLDEQSPENDHE
ncbi:hypothetical protein ACFONG_15065 [Uliginosibacterium paludis]|uniref:Integrase catalytic domain-containing protein n=1 Tax=Uliginosibacterium paludis TaxID=1615952 RepID=A0ABV2CTF5_9RHOO